MAVRQQEDAEFADDEFVRNYTERMLRDLSNFREYTNEGELIELTMKEPLVVHFYKSTFPKCVKMNNALKELSKKFPEIKFGWIDVDKCPRMTVSLKIKVLPFVGFFKDGYYVDQMVGFEKLGNSESLDIRKLEEYIKNSVFFTIKNEEDKRMSHRERS